MFTQPSPPGTGLAWADHLGALLVIHVLGQEHGVETVHGTSNPVRANVYVIEGPGAGAVYDDALIFPLGLIAQTQRHVGQKILARLAQGQKQPGKNAPWMLEPSKDPKEARQAEDFLTKQAQKSFTTPDGDPPF